MVTTHNLGYPRIGLRRELKFALESYWSGQIPADGLTEQAAALRRRHWAEQGGLDLVPVGDFSLYDHVLDMSVTLGHLPERVRGLGGDGLDAYFRVARGRPAQGRDEHADCCAGVAAAEMTKWFDTNYHYLVPEFHADTSFELDASRLLEQVREAQRDGVRAKPVLLGPVSYLALGKSKDGSERLALLPRLLPVYARLLQALAEQGVSWVQIDEPILVTELDMDWQQAFNLAYHRLRVPGIRLLLATYFGPLLDNRYLAANLPVDGLHVDLTRGLDDLAPLLNLLPAHKVLSLGVISGRNVWKSDLSALLDWLEPLAARLGDRLWLAPSCSLLHVPMDLEAETAFDPEIRAWLAFARQKLEELQLLARALDQGRESVREALDANRAALASRRASPRVHRPEVRAALEAVTPQMGRRASPHALRAARQAEIT